MRDWCAEAHIDIMWTRFYAFPMSARLNTAPHPALTAFTGPITLVCAGLLLAPASRGEAAEYYSWIDPSGVMVMTDDPSRIPSPTLRSPVEVHRFDDRPSNPQPVMQQTPAPPAVSIDHTAQPPAPVDPVKDLGLPPVMLTQPEEAVRSRYVWVPLQQPMTLGGDTVSGFWWHSAVSSPIDAFKAFLRQQPHWGFPRTAWGVPSAGTSVPSVRSMNPVYDQVVRERQALVDRTFPVSPFGTPGRHPDAGAGLRSKR